MPAGTPLAELLEVGLKEQTLAPAILSALFAELSQQKEYVEISDRYHLLC